MSDLCGCYAALLSALQEFMRIIHEDAIFPKIKLNKNIFIRDCFQWSREFPGICVMYILDGKD